MQGPPSVIGNNTILIDRFPVEEFWDAYNWLFYVSMSNSVFTFQACVLNEKHCCGVPQKGLGSLCYWVLIFPIYKIYVWMIALQYVLLSHQFDLFQRHKEERRNFLLHVVQSYRGCETIGLKDHYLEGCIDKKSVMLAERLLWKYKGN
ncbi:hypothetical protein M5K25_005592 [Dendrobium thyrsiflorum]|uniref:Uncharacterized protein n=1 Tax=Dendrobium thyrsiflorum TaxID=117978 RepID=A0ABD0VIV8_DENTH